MQPKPAQDHTSETKWKPEWNTPYQSLVHLIQILYSYADICLWKLSWYVSDTFLDFSNYQLNIVLGLLHFLCFFFLKSQYTAVKSTINFSAVT